VAHPPGHRGTGPKRSKDRRYEFTGSGKVLQRKEHRPFEPTLSVLRVNRAAARFTGLRAYATGLAIFFLQLVLEEIFYQGLYALGEEFLEMGA
jgi:hypothetical protein